MNKRLLASVAASTVLVLPVTAAVTVPAHAAGPATASKVSVSSPTGRTPQNHQNETALAIDAHQPNVLVSGWNDWRDVPMCPQDAATNDGRCFDGPGTVGLSAVAFSFDSGHSWVQPQYTGWTARDCTTVCDGHFGTISTLPWYYESALTSGGDPAVTIGPRPGPHGFSWANGSRVYYGTLVRNFGPTAVFKGYGALAVSRLDDPTPARVAQKSSWLRPVVANTRLSSTVFEDKEQIWADNASSSAFFGRVYMCHTQYRGASLFPQANEPAPLEVTTSADGGATWRTKQLVPATTGGRGPTEFGLSGCTVRTTSTGDVYVFAEMFQNPSLSGLPTHGAHVMFVSHNGGATWSRMRILFRVTDLCSFIDPVEGRCVMDGYAGARTDLSAGPSVDIANGAPTGRDATNEIVDSWADGGAGLNQERTMLAWSTNGTSWHAPVALSLAGDRPIYAAPGISPNGNRVYVVYEAVRSPWRGTDMTSPRPYRGVFRSASVGASGAPTGWTTEYTGPTGDLRGTYPGHDIYQERVGDYVYAVASRTYGAGVWTDARDAEVCDAVQQYRAASIAAGTRALPAPWPLPICPRFGNTDVWSASTG
jgi:hypothetical protein